MQTKVVEPGGSLHAFAATETQSDSGVVVLDSDLIFNPCDLPRLLSFAGSPNMANVPMVVAVTADSRQDLTPVKVLCTEAMEIRAIGRDISETPYVLAGMYFCRLPAYAGVNELLSSGPPGFIRYLTWAAGKGDMRAFRVGAVQDVDRPEDIEAAERLLRSITAGDGG